MALCLLLPAYPQQPAGISAAGFITDTLSGRTGATALHAAATRRNVESGMAKYAVYDERSKQLYILDPQDQAVGYLGQRVTVTGTLSPTALKRAGQKQDPSTGEVKDFHSLRARSSTPVAGVLTVSSISLAPVTNLRHP